MRKLENTHTVRVELVVTCPTDSDAIRKLENYVKELPRMEDVGFRGATLYSVREKRVIKTLD